MSDTQSNSGLCVVTGTTPAALERLRAVLAAVKVVSVFIEPATPVDIGAVAAAIAIAQQAGAGALIVGDTRLARTLKAEGVHLPASLDAEKALVEAREELGERFAIGVDAGTTRHDAMTLAEGGADYVAFAASGDAEAEDHCLEMIDWWAEIFEVPCLAWDVRDSELAVALADRGADFIALRLPEGESPAAAADNVRAIKAAMQHGLVDQ
jgi:thiamine-phosphate pyrophosphorylase